MNDTAHGCVSFVPLSYACTHILSCLMEIFESQPDAVTTSKHHAFIRCIQDFCLAGPGNVLCATLKLILNILLCSLFVLKHADVSVPIQFHPILAVYGTELTALSESDAENRFLVARTFATSRSTDSSNTSYVVFLSNIFAWFDALVSSLPVF